ncbi:LPS export ABC transporter periplasmic protein LptC [Gymnodinialimonas sp. 57CJ19]|uniref:LPS export ABC transporter periplasmic protein LptC n=1 Tax=Gymnodinialimonas sp. 57CJ19 TaxID=3138498 RepID=UPI00313442D9
MVRDNLYSKAVVWVKITLPLIALALLSSIFLLSGAPDPDAALAYTEVDVNEIEREQRVSEPRFAGVIGDGQEIVLTAQAVTTGVETTDRIRAETIVGRMDLGATDSMTIQAAFGEFDMAAQMATFTDDVVLQSSLGYRIQSETLVMALDVINMRSPTPVHATGPGIDVTADTMEVTGPQGETILRFNGAVRVLYEPQS